MVTKKKLIIEKYLLMVEQLRKILNVDIFPEFNDVVDILFYFQYNFMMVQHPPEKNLFFYCKLFNFQKVYFEFLKIK